MFSTAGVTRNFGITKPAGVSITTKVAMVTSGTNGTKWTTVRDATVSIALEHTALILRSPPTPAKSLFTQSSHPTLGLPLLLPSSTLSASATDVIYIKSNKLKRTISKLTSSVCTNISSVGAGNVDALLRFDL